MNDDAITRYVLKWTKDGKGEHEICHLQYRAGQRAGVISHTADNQFCEVIRQEWYEDGRYWRDVAVFKVIDGDVKAHSEISDE